MTYWKTEHFRALQKAWYRRLEESGFRDAEELTKDDLVLKQSSFSGRNRTMDELSRESKAAYFRLLSQKVQSALFKSEVDRLILLRYTEGVPIKLICRELEEDGRPRCRNTVTFTVRKYEMQWGLRAYTARQLNKKEAS